MTEPQSGLDYNSLMGITLKSLRSKKNILQSDLMQAAGVSRATWSRIENGQSSIDFTQLTSILRECFDISLNDFFAYMSHLDKKLKVAIEEEAEEKDIDSNKFLMTLGALGVGAVVGFLAKQIADDWDV
ncbi:MAG: helix-turn-helix transcriptional regulator [Spirochaetota bacterium]